MRDDLDLGFVVLDTQRLRQFDEFEARNPPESGFRILRTDTASQRVRLRYDQAQQHIREALDG